TYAPTGLDLQNFIAHAEFTNPYPASEGDWDIGFIFRLAENEADLRLIVASTGDWLLATGSQQAVGQGRVDGLNVGRNERNSIDLVVDGDTGYFGVNDQFVSELDLSSVDGSGDIAVATGFFQGSSQSGASTPYRNFVVWSLEAAPATPESTRTARTPEPTARAGERTATPTAGGTYESPTYGYAIAYDESWTPSNESSRNGVDIVSFDNGVSQIDVQGFPTDQTPVECVDDEFNFYETGEGFSNAEVAVDTNNQEMRGEAPDRAYGVFTLTFTPQNGRPVDLTSFVECIEIESGVSMLKIVQLVTVRDYNDQIDARQGLLDGLTIPGKGAEGSPEARTVTPEASETPADATPGTTGAAIVVQISPAADPKVTGLATIDRSGNRATIRVLAVGADDGTVVLIQEGACDSLS
ncbi:MAG: hypothetical protein IRY92_10235, partial [Dactylosporangium sp.]|nr:hypothetical protein [Dactylosporangium sp.]